MFWNKFGHPQGLITRIGDYRDIPSLWWIDPDKIQKLEGRLKDSSIPVGGGPERGSVLARVREARGDSQRRRGDRAIFFAGCC